MHYSSSAFLAVFVLLWSVSAQAAPNVTPTPTPALVTDYLRDDSGLISCGKILEQDSTGVGRAQWRDFIGGYLTGVNSLRGRHTPTLDITSAYAWIVNYCREKPLESSKDAFAGLDRKLGPGKWPVVRDSAKSVPK